MKRKYRHWLSIGVILVWSGLLLAACQDTVVEGPMPTAVEPLKTPARTAPPGVISATLTQQVVADFIATTLAENPRTTATPEPPDANMAAANANSQTRIAGQATAMKQGFLATQQAPTPDIAALVIPVAPPPQIDGVIGNDEWHGAAKQTITVDNRQATVYIQHDQAALFIAFTDFNQTGRPFFTEILLDTHGEKGSQMDDNDWWFQAAATPCWGSGPNAVWQQCGTPENWRVSHWTVDVAVVEMAIPYETIGLVPDDNRPIGLAFALLSVTTDGQEIRLFWPNTAELNAPQTWGTALAPDGW
jgi:hypothetical protein